MAHSSLAIANEFLKRAQAEGKPLTHMHLQKLVYIAHGWNMAQHNEPLIDEQFHAWDFGPVAPGLYRALKRYGSKPIERLIRRGDDYDPPVYGDDEIDGEPVRATHLLHSERAVIDQIWNDFKGYKAFQLSALTHKDRSPWHSVYNELGKNAPIANNSIQDYFTQLADAP